MVNKNIIKIRKELDKLDNSLLDIIIFGRRAAVSAQNSLPERRRVTLTRLKEFRASLGINSARQQLLSPQLFPTQTGMKISFERKVIMESQDENSRSTNQLSFEPPDPFTK